MYTFSFKQKQGPQSGHEGMQPKANGPKSWKYLTGFYAHCTGATRKCQLWVREFAYSRSSTIRFSGLEKKKKKHTLAEKAWLSVPQLFSSTSATRLKNDTVKPDMICMQTVMWRMPVGPSVYILTCC